MMFTSNMPTEPGWYWLISPHEAPQIVYIRDYAGNLSLGNNPLAGWPKMLKSLWAGPILMPELTQDQKMRILRDVWTELDHSTQPLSRHRIEWTCSERGNIVTLNDLLNAGAITQFSILTDDFFSTEQEPWKNKFGG